MPWPQPNICEWYLQRYPRLVHYLDDILIFLESQTLHSHHIQQVLECLKKNGLYTKLEKYDCDRTPIDFLGYVI